MNDPLWAAIYQQPLDPTWFSVVASSLWAVLWRAFIGLLVFRLLISVAENIVIWYAKFKGRWRWWCTRCEWNGVCSKAREAGYCDGRKKPMKGQAQ